MLKYDKPVKVLSEVEIGKRQKEKTGLSNLIRFFPLTKATMKIYNHHNYYFFLTNISTPSPNEVDSFHSKRS